MIVDRAKQEVMADFCEFIENLPEAHAISSELIDQESGSDLFVLCKEMLSLKTEVKQSSRQFKTALDSFKEVFNTLEHSHEVLSKELSERRENQQFELENQKYTVLKPLLLELIEVRDRLEIGIGLYKPYNTNFFSRLFLKPYEAFVSNVREGQMMSLRRIEHLLAQYEVQSLNTLQQSFDPSFMRAIEIVQQTEVPNGIVISEVRKGFTWKDKVLRLAEVIVNKTSNAEVSV